MNYTKAKNGGLWSFLGRRIVIKAMVKWTLRRWPREKNAFEATHWESLGFTFKTGLNFHVIQFTGLHIWCFMMTLWRQGSGNATLISLFWKLTGLITNHRLYIFPANQLRFEKYWWNDENTINTWWRRSHFRTWTLIVF